jgi:hypothetical protein
LRAGGLLSPGGEEWRISGVGEVWGKLGVKKIYCSREIPFTCLLKRFL